MPSQSQSDYHYSLAGREPADHGAGDPGRDLLHPGLRLVGPDHRPRTTRSPPRWCPFAIQAVDPGQVGHGTATIEIDGSKFDNNTTFQLLGPNSTVVNDQTVYLQDSSTAFVTFNLTGMPLGTYDVQATQADGTHDRAGPGAHAWLPPRRRQREYLPLVSGRACCPTARALVTVNYINEGNTDVLAPLLQLTATNAP